MNTTSAKRRNAFTVTLLGLGASIVTSPTWAHHHAEAESSLIAVVEHANSPLVIAASLLIAASVYLVRLRKLTVAKKIR